MYDYTLPDWGGYSSQKKISLPLYEAHFLSPYIPYGTQGVWSINGQEMPFSSFWYLKLNSSR